MNPLPATFFGEFGWHFLGLAVGCAVLTIAVYGYAFDGKLGRMFVFWIAATALSAMLAIGAAVIGAAILAASIMVEEIESELRDPPEYMQSLPPWRTAPRSPEEPTQPEDTQ